MEPKSKTYWIFAEHSTAQILTSKQYNDEARRRGISIDEDARAENEALLGLLWRIEYNMANDGVGNLSRDDLGRIAVLIRHSLHDRNIGTSARSDITSYEQRALNEISAAVRPLADRPIVRMNYRLTFSAESLDHDALSAILNGIHERYGIRYRYERCD